MTQKLTIVGFCCAAAPFAVAAQQFKTPDYQLQIEPPAAMQKSLVREAMTSGLTGRATLVGNKKDAVCPLPGQAEDECDLQVGNVTIGKYSPVFAPIVLNTRIDGGTPKRNNTGGEKK